MNTITQKLRVGVLLGGKSIEREVSLNSGRTVCDHLDTARYEIIPIFQTEVGDLYILPQRFLHRGKTADFEHRLPNEAEKINWDILATRIDFAFIAMHGRYAEDGLLQGTLEVLGIPYLGSKVLSSALGMNKQMQKEFLRIANIDVPASITIAPHQLNDLQKLPEQEQLTTLKQLCAKAQLNFPLVIKPQNEGSSLGVSIITTWEELFPALTKAAHITQGIIQPVLVEEKIEGMEFACIVVTDYKTGEYIPLPPTEIVPESAVYEFDQKYMPGRAQKFTPARCTQEQQKLIQQTCIRVMDALGFTTEGRIDGFLTKDNKIIIIDPNTISGMAPSSFAFLQAAQQGFSHTQFINHLIEAELFAYGMFDAVTARESMEQKQTEKIRVAVLFGGDSAEREISLESGRNIVYKLSPQKYVPIPMFVSPEFKIYPLDSKTLVLNSTHEISLAIAEHQIPSLEWSNLPATADFVFLGLHGGRGENGCVQGILEMLGLPYNGSGVLTSALCMDKFKTNNFLRQQGFSVPEGVLITTQELGTKEITCSSLFAGRVDFPLIVKPHDDGCSTLVQKVRSDAELITALQAIFATKRDSALVEECICGMELTVGVIGNEKPEALPPSQAVVQKDILTIEEKFLPGAGENQTPALLPSEKLTLVQDTIAQAYQALQCKGYARIDCFYQTADESPTKVERVVILEVNTLPGMTPATCIFHQAAELGMKPMDFVDKIIELGFAEHGQRSTAKSLNTAKSQQENL